MKYYPGQPKPEGSGRKKGTKNQKRIPKVAARLIEMGINPAEEALKAIYQLSPGERFDAWMEVISYCEAKPRYVEPIIVKRTKMSSSKSLRACPRETF